MKQYDFVINFITEMKQLDAAAVAVPKRVKDLQRRVEQASIVTPSGISQRIQAGETALASHGKERIRRVRDLIKGDQELAASQKSNISVLNKQAQAFHKGNVAMRESARQLGGLSGTYRSAVAVMRAQPIGEILGKVGLWTIATTAIFGTIAAIKDIICEAIKLESVFADLKRVINPVDIGKITDATFRLSQGFGAVAGDVAKSAFEWGKTTRIIEDVMAGQTATLLATKVAEMDLGSATKYLTAMYHSLGLKGNEIIGIVDMLNEVQNRFGVNIENMATALARTSGLMKVYSGDLEQLTAIIGTMMKVTGAEPTRVATAIRTSMMHIRRNAADLEMYGIAVRDTNGALLSMEKIYDNIMTATTKMSKTRKMEILTLIAEGRSYDIWAAALNNSNLILQMQEAAVNSANSAVYEYSLIMNTVSENIARMRSGVSELAYTLGEAGLTDSISDSIQAFSGLLSILTKVAGMLKVINERAEVKFPTWETGGEKKVEMIFSPIRTIGRLLGGFTPAEEEYGKLRQEQVGRMRYALEQSLYVLGITLDEHRDLHKATAVMLNDQEKSEKGLIDDMVERTKSEIMAMRTMKVTQKEIGKLEKTGVRSTRAYKAWAEATRGLTLTVEEQKHAMESIENSIRESADIAEELTEAELEVIDNLNLSKAKFAAGLVTREQYISALRIYIKAIIKTNDPDRLAAIAELNRQLADIEKEAIDLMSARLDLEIATTGDPLAQARLNLSKEKTILGNLKDKLDILKQRTTIIKAQQQMEREIYNLRMAEAKLGIAGMVEPLDRESAMLALEQSTLDYIRSTEGASAALTLEASLIDRSRSLQISRFEMEKRILDMRQELGEISIEQQIAAIQKLAKGVTLTREQSYQLRLELQRLQKESREQAKESFNLPNIELPTVYEMRRGISGGYSQEYYDNRNIVINVSKDVDISLLEAAISRSIDREVYIGGTATGLRPKIY